MNYKNILLEDFIPSLDKHKRPYKDYTGKKFGKLKVICRAPDGKRQQARYWCECNCGNITCTHAVSFERGVKSCLKCSNQKLSKGKVLLVGEIPVSFWNHNKKRAEKNGVIFNVTIKQGWELFLKQKKCCALSGQPIRFCIGNADTENGWKGRLIHTASIDRIDPKKGYTLNNIQWVHKDINFMKGSFKKDYFIKICKSISTNYKNKLEGKI